MRARVTLAMLDDNGQVIESHTGEGTTVEEAVEAATDQFEDVGWNEEGFPDDEEDEEECDGE